MFPGEGKVKLIPPDGGWGWLVALGSFLITYLCPLMAVNFSLLYSELIHTNDASTATIAWIFNLGHVLYAFSSLLAPAACAGLGHRQVAFFGSLLVGISVIMSAFIKVIEALYLTFSLLYGIGAGFAVSVWQFIIPHYFEKRRGVVIGFITSGLCASQFFIPLLITKLQDIYGSHGTILITGALVLNMCVGASLFQPSEWHSKKQIISHELIQLTDEKKENPIQENPECKFEKLRAGEGKDCTSTDLASSLPLLIDSSTQATVSNKNEDSKLPRSNLFQRFGDKSFMLFRLIVNDVKLFKFVRVIFITISFSLKFTIYVNILMLTKFSVENKGGTNEVTAMGFTIMGTCNILTRICISALTDLFDVKARWYFIGGSFLTTISILTFSFVTEDIWIYICLGLFGVGMGCCLCLFVTLIIEVMGVELVPSTFGGVGMMNMITFLVIGPLLGYIRDATEDYDLCLRILSAIDLIPLLLWAFMPLAVKFDRWKNK